MRSLWLGIVGLAAASTANAAVVTFTLSLNEGANGTVTANSYAVYATVSQGDNFGLFGYGVDMKLPSEGGPTTLTITPRSPFGHWVIDDADPNWDPDGSYPNKVAGFGLFRGTSPSGAVAGNQDISQYDPLKGDGRLPCSSELVILRGVGQTAGNLNTAIPGKAMGIDGTCSVGWKPYTRDGSPTSDNPYGNRPGFVPLPAGSIRLFTGTWTGNTFPSIQTTVDTKAGVWRTNAASGPEAIQVDVANVLTAVTEPLDLGRNFVGLANTAVAGIPTNVAVGGSIAVTGSNNRYISEVDQLISDNVTVGNTPITTIGDEAGNIYVMAKLNGTAAEVASFLNTVTADVDSTDSQFAALHQNYDNLFPGGSFNALFKFPNIAGAKVFSIDTTFTTGVSVDAIAAVPEPAAMSWMAFAGMGLLARRRREV